MLCVSERERGCFFSVYRALAPLMLQNSLKRSTKSVLVSAKCLSHVLLTQASMQLTSLQTCLEIMF